MPRYTNLDELERMSNEATAIETKSGFMALVKLIPTIDIVRCKDCKYYNSDYFDNFYEKPICMKTYCCDGSHKEVNENDFCSMGERRKDESND